MGIRAEQISDFNSFVQSCYYQTVSFSTSIPFTKATTSISYTITGNVTITPDTSNAVPGAMTILRVTGSTGVLTPGGAFKKDDSSLDFNISLGQNTIYMWYDGANYWYKVSRIGS